MLRWGAGLAGMNQCLLCFSHSHTTIRKCHTECDSLEHCVHSVKAIVSLENFVSLLSFSNIGVQCVLPIHIDVSPVIRVHFVSANNVLVCIYQVTRIACLIGAMRSFNHVASSVWQCIKDTPLSKIQLLATVIFRPGVHSTHTHKPSKRVQLTKEEIKPLWPVARKITQGSIWLGLMAIRSVCTSSLYHPVYTNLQVFCVDTVYCAATTQPARESKLAGRENCHIWRRYRGIVSSCCWGRDEMK